MPGAPVVSSSHSVVQHLRNAVRKRNLQIDSEGKILRILQPVQFRAAVLKLYCLVVVELVARMILNYQYHPVTVMGNYVYSRVVSGALTMCGVPHVLCKGTGRVIHYETSDAQLIPFEGIPGACFPPTTCPAIPHTQSDLAELAAHTNLSNLAQAEGLILSRLSVVNGLPSLDLASLLTGAYHKEPIVQVRRFFGTLFFVRTASECWITRTILSDGTPPLMQGNILTRLYSTVIEQSSNEENATPMVVTLDDCCQVHTATHQISLTCEASHRVEADLSITSINETEAEPSLIYYLQQPRPLMVSGLYTLHPFHLPVSYDPFLTIMTVALAITRP